MHLLLLVLSEFLNVCSSAIVDTCRSRSRPLRPAHHFVLFAAAVRRALVFGKPALGVGCLKKKRQHVSSAFIPGR